MYDMVFWRNARQKVWSALKMGYFWKFLETGDGGVCLILKLYVNLPGSFWYANININFFIGPLFPRVNVRIITTKVYCDF